MTRYVTDFERGFAVARGGLAHVAAVHIYGNYCLAAGGEDVVGHTLMSDYLSRPLRYEIRVRNSAIARGRLMRRCIGLNCQRSLALQECFRAQERRCDPTAATISVFKLCTASPFSILFNRETLSRPGTLTLPKVAVSMLVWREG